MSDKKKVGVVLAGCGYLDGAEIHEATLTLLALDNRGVDIQCMAPAVEQMHVVDHTKGEAEEGQSRNVLRESSRIARGEIVDIASVNVDDFDAIIFPGGFGAAKNLSTFAIDGTDMSVNEHVAQLITAMHKAGKPQGFICIAPAIAAKVLGEHKPRLTIGLDQETGAALESMGATHVECQVDGIIVDQDNKLVSTAAYMLGPSIAHVNKGIDKLVATVVEMLD